MSKDPGTVTVACPTCGKDVPFRPESRWRPFCSERCRLIDLGAWFDEENAIPGEDVPLPGDENSGNEGL